MTTPDCVIALSFGYQIRNGQRLPGLSNEALAKVVDEQYDYLPKILQFEVADSYSLLKDEPVLRIEPGDSYLDTHGVFEKAVAVCRKAKWTQVSIVAHPVHVRRCAQVAEKFGLGTDESQLERMEKLEIPFDPDSEQSWTRSAAAAKAHELGAGWFYKIMNRG